MELPHTASMDLLTCVLHQLHAIPANLFAASVTFGPFTENCFVIAFDQCKCTKVVHELVHSLGGYVDTDHSYILVKLSCKRHTLILDVRHPRNGDVKLVNMTYPNSHDG